LRCSFLCLACVHVLAYLFQSGLQLFQFEAKPMLFDVGLAFLEELGVSV